MAEQQIKAMVEGGKASAGPPLGPALGPMGVNIGQVISTINEKTAAFKGMQIPVTVCIDPKTKAFRIEVGTPPASGLIKAEAKIEKGSGSAKVEKVADILIEQIIKVALMKESALLGKTLKDRVKEIVGTCQSMGVLVEGKEAKDTMRDIEAGKYDKEIAAKKTELTVEEQKKLEEEKKKMQADIEKRKVELEKLGHQIIAENDGKEKGFIKKKLLEAGIPVLLVEELMGQVKGPAAAPGKEAPGAAPAAGGKAAAPAAGGKAPAGKK